MRKLRILLTFGYIWAAVGFASGTATLLGPVRWLTSSLRRAGASQRTEDLLVLGIILLLIGGSLLLARGLTRRVLNSHHLAVAVGIPLLVTAAAGGSMWRWWNPAAITGSGGLPADRVAVAETEFVFGPYPSAERLAELRREGYDGVVSLLHPAVVPFEPKLIADERAAAGRAKLLFIHAPMLPWVSSNDASLERIRDLARTGRGRYYVHCYLGKDRANVVRHALAALGARTVSGEGLRRVKSLAERDRPFERGPIHELEDEIYLIPYPNEHEFFSYLLTGGVATVVSLLDPSEPEELALLAAETELLGKHRVQLLVRTLPRGAQPDSLADELVGEVRHLPRPVAVHSVYSDPYRSPAVESFLQAYKRQLPPTSPAFQAMEGILRERD